MPPGDVHHGSLLAKQMHSSIGVSYRPRGECRQTPEYGKAREKEENRISRHPATAQSPASISMPSAESARAMLQKMASAVAGMPQTG